MSNEVNDASRAGKVCETFRANPANRKWAGSYTENVWSRLGMVKVFKPLTPEDVAALVEARDLLWDYHHTQHEVYEQRDTARAMVLARLVIENTIRGLVQSEVDVIRSRLRVIESAVKMPGGGQS